MFLLLHFERCQQGQTERVAAWLSLWLALLGGKLMQFLHCLPIHDQANSINS